MSAVRRRDAPWLRDAASVRRHGRGRPVRLGLGSALSRRRVATALAVKFNSFWTIELDTGFSHFATHPVNRDDLPFRTLTGLVDADRFNAVGILFPAVWTDTEFQGVLSAGTPVAQCFPVAREAISLRFETFTPEQVDAYDAVADALHATPGVYRKDYRDRRPASDK